MRTIITIILISFLCILCASCDPSYSYVCYIENKYNNSIGLTFLHYNDSIIILPNQRVVVEEQLPAIGGGNHDIFRVINNHEMEQCEDTYLYSCRSSYSKIYFNDTIVINYRKEDSFSKNICYINNWTILKNEHKKGGKHIEVLYTITEDDYQNAISRK